MRTNYARPPVNPSLDLYIVRAVAVVSVNLIMSIFARIRIAVSSPCGSFWRRTFTSAGLCSSAMVQSDTVVLVSVLTVLLVMDLSSSVSCPAASLSVESLSRTPCV